MYIYNVHVNGFSSAVCTKNGTHMTFNVFVSDFWMSVYKIRIMTAKLRFGVGFTVQFGTRTRGVCVLGRLVRHCVALAFFSCC